MTWNWQHPDWPNFVFDSSLYVENERAFIHICGKSQGYLKAISKSEFDQFKVEILSLEGAESAKIEGEILDRESLQSSIRRQFGLDPLLKKESVKEQGMAESLLDVFKTFQDPLDHKTLFRWHSYLFKGSTELDCIGSYRRHSEPMQIVSNKYGSDKVFFEAPPSGIVLEEMNRFIDWYNNFKGQLLVKASIAHLYFESIHPFEDGNGRIGRLIVEKTLSQGLKHPSLISISKLLEEKKKDYYNELEKCNHSLKINDWIAFFSSKIIEAQKTSLSLLEFIILKSKIFNSLQDSLNDRQIKVLLRVFREGPAGFKGGLSAENYIAITKTSRATATRDLQDLLDKGVFLKTGELKSTRYFINLEFSF
jgi:Fic family protein